MEVEPGTAAGEYEYEGETYHFCATACRERFVENPERFL